jgi:mannose-6-phosphate isomerase-like protein (cupin superfamily)
MKYLNPLFAFSASLLVIILLSAFVKHRQAQPYLLEHDENIAVPETGPHKGGGNTIAYPYFNRADDLKLVFRKRLLKPGSAIGYHLQEKDEIYCIISGKGEMTVNGKTFTVLAGDAILTRAGNSHGLRPTGDSNLVLIINYEK